MKRYLVVAHDGYYPDWMLNNIRGHFDQKEEAIEFRNYILDKKIYEHADVYDQNTFEPDDFHYRAYLSSIGS